ncbi:FAD-dependent oxidoreductase [Mesorhizobium sp.]|uniref:FAD-dependent oxidoreductase n=1 Tax=Mesorhizobium sp. TaxID=1871066 RepID=UPI000FE6FA0C|nr:FAD-dependent oxidoreductase [Mesorhizobium sp.]RWP99095.1 MAG: FAD-dependent oxidoreductase [Mesorhizobium sp.]RWQ27602.1 MAG: FAD-dependent oxidoreductase [Mesorhizobium sp.]
MEQPAPFPGWRIDNRIDGDPALPSLAEIEVLVVGGGAAGVAAATVAAEKGKSVILVERYGFCGGAAVAGMSGTICGLYLASETRNRPAQVVFGFAERFRSALAKRGGLTKPQIYGKTFTVTHDPLMWRETADRLLEDAGVRVLFHTAVTGVLMDGQVLRGVIVESNAGRSVIRAKRIIDASGDAAVVARAGYRYTFGDKGKIQNPTMFFRLGNVDLDAFGVYWGADTICPPKVVEAIEAADHSGAYRLPRNKIWIFPTTRPNELMVNATRLSGRDGRMLNVIDPADFTEAEIFGRQQVREYARFLTDMIPGCADSFVVDTGVEAGIRQTRSIVGKATLRNEDVVDCRKRDDGICRVPWPIELHSGDKPKLHWLLDDYYEVPYGALVPEIGENIIVAGRCLSAEHEALASARVTAQCFEYGHAAATAAVMSIDQVTPFSDLRGEDVREAMTHQGSAL